MVSKKNKPFWVLLFLQLSFAHAQVRFEQTKDLNLVFAKAKKENKLIFIDAYTDWCSWCKVLDKKVFCAGNVADTMNKYFVSAKFEMEKDSFGVLLARKYAVKGFPTALILNANGQLIDVIIGYSEPDKYLSNLMKYVTAGPKQKALSGFSSTLTPDFPDFYLNVFPITGKSVFPDSLTVSAFWQKESSITNEVGWCVLNRFYFFIDDQQLSSMLSNIDLLNKNYGTSSVQNLLNYIFSSRVWIAIKANDKKKFNTTLQQATTYLINSKEFVFSSTIDQYKKDSNWVEMGKLVQQTILDSSFEISPSSLNDYCWTIYLKCNDKEVLKTAIGWMENIVLKKNPQYAHYDTYAALLYKAKEYEKAKTAAIKAISIGKEEKQEDLSETESLLKKIEEQMLKK